MEGSVHLPTLITGCTFSFEWTSVTGCRIGLILRLLCLLIHPSEVHRLTVGADIETMRRVVGEPGGPLVLPVWQGNRGTDILGAEWP